MKRTPLVLFVSLAACVGDPPATEPPPAPFVEPALPTPPAEPHCWRCDRVWTAAELESHERHRVELNMMMYASGCEYCRNHGAYKDVQYSGSHSPPPQPPSGPGD